MWKKRWTRWFWGSARVKRKCIDSKVISTFSVNFWCQRKAQTQFINLDNQICSNWWLIRLTLFVRNSSIGFLLFFFNIVCSIFHVNGHKDEFGPNSRTFKPFVFVHINIYINSLCMFELAGHSQDSPKELNHYYPIKIHIEFNKFLCVLNWLHTKIPTQFCVYVCVFISFT